MPILMRLPVAVMMPSKVTIIGFARAPGDAGVAQFVEGRSCGDGRLARPAGRHARLSTSEADDLSAIQPSKIYA